MSFLAKHANLLGLIKQWRKQHGERQELESIIWDDPSVETAAGDQEL